MKAAIAAAVAIVLVIVAWMPLADDGAPPAATERIVETQRQPRGENPQPASATAVDPAALRAPPVEEWKSTDLPATVARRMRDAADKRAFYDRAVSVGGGAHLMMARLAASRCREVTGLGMVGAQQDAARMIPANDPDFETRMAAARSLIAGCEGFEMLPIAAADLDALDKRLAQETDLTARAFALSRETRLREDSKILARELVETGDPWMLRLVSYHLVNGFLTRAPLSGMTQERVKEGEREIYAWTWAVCELGFDCGAESDIALAACLHGNCKPKPPEEGVRIRKDEIVAAVRARDWKTLGL
jgi:hypothetical protein